MRKVKAAIIYYSSTGANYQMAQWAAASAEDAGCEVRLRKAAELAPQEAINASPAWKKNLEKTQHVTTASLDDIEWADTLIFCIPTRYGNVPAQIKQLLDATGPLWMQGKLVNKIVTAMSSAENTHGGQEETILSLYTTMYHWGAIVVSPSYTDEVVYKAGGNPYGTSVTVDENGNIKEDKEAVREAVYHQAKRAVHVTAMLLRGAEEEMAGEAVSEFDKLR